MVGLDWGVVSRVVGICRLRESAPKVAVYLTRTGRCMMHGGICKIQVRWSRSKALVGAGHVWLDKRA
jgi:hypothetical protein